MMEYLMLTGGRYSFEMLGGQVLVAHSHRLKPEELHLLLETTRRWLERIPQMVWSEYRALGAG